MPSLHELYIILLEVGCMHTLLIARAHFYGKLRGLLLGVICRSSQT